jgi:pyruvate dehydrogenase E2 component (dihydrolipoamide acetyltransferase)
MKERLEYNKIPKTDRLTPDDILDASILVSNIGSINRNHRGNVSMLEIIPPQVAVIGVSAIQEKPGVFVNSEGKKEIGIRSYLPMCIAFDHRWLDYIHVVPFQQTIDEILANPTSIRDL